jgi:hypothetical protein
MPIIDSQIHPYEANTPKRPWHNTPNWPPSATADENVAAMDKLGIDRDPDLVFLDVPLRRELCSGSANRPSFFRRA